MKERSQRDVRQELESILISGWKQIGKNQNENSLSLIMNDIYTVKCDTISESLKKAVKDAFTKQNKKLLIQLLSISYDAKLKKNDMERLFDIIISWRTFKTVHWHTVMHGVGAIVPEDIINVRNVTRRKDVVIEFVKFLVNAGFKTAEAVDRKLSSGALVVVAKIYRKETVHCLIEDFKRHRIELLQLGPRGLNKGRKGIREYVALSNQSMIEIVKVVCPYFLRCLGALDTTSEVHGRQNYLIIRKTLEEIKIGFNQFTPTSEHLKLVNTVKAAIDVIVKSVDSVEAFLKCKTKGNYDYIYINVL